MASRVNVKFVAILAAGLTVVFAGVAVLAYNAVRTSAAEHAAKGDAFFAQGDFKKATESYAKAVNKERTRIEYLDKWGEAILKTTPETEVEYNRAYQMHFMVLQTKAALLDTDAAAQRAYLDARMAQFKLVRASPETWQNLAGEVDERIARLEAGTPETEALRRYRGLANNRLMQLLPDRTEVRERALTDLQAAVKAAREMGQEDVEAQIAIVWWHLLEWRRNVRERRPERAETHLLAVREALDDLVERFPNDPEVLVNDLLVRLDLAMVDKRTPGERRAAIEAARGTEEAPLRAILTNTERPADIFTIERFEQALRLMRPETAGETVLEIADTLLARRPDDLFLLRLRAGALSSLGRHEEAIAAHQRIIDMPDRPVSLEGLALKGLRLECLRQQAEAWLSLRAQAADSAARDAAMEAAKGRRNALAERVREGSAPALRLLDGKIAMAEDRPNVAVSHLNAVDLATPDTEPMKIEAIELLAEALRRMNQPGAARGQYERLITLTDSMHTGAVIAAAAIDVQLGETKRAERRIEDALVKQPDSEELRWRLAALQAREGGDVKGIDDPVVAALLVVDRYRNLPEPDFENARRVITEALVKQPGEIRLHAARIQIEAEAGAVDLFELALTEALEKFPDNATFLDYKRRLAVLESSDRVETIVKFIDESDSPPAQREVRKYDVYRQADRLEDARAALARAASINPDEPMVIERQFLEALTGGNMARAAEIAGRAARLNVDQADGLMYQARLELARDDLRAALSTLERAVEKLPYSVLGWRMLGQVHMALGNVSRAVAALQKAYDFQPQDVQTTQVLVQALVSLQRMGDAVAIARAAREKHPRNADIGELWLSLEEVAGDPQVALAKRTERFRSAPTDKRNIVALGRLLIHQKKWAEARALFDAAASYMQHDVEFAILEARWRGLQAGRPGVGVEAGREYMREFIGRLPADKLGATPYLALGAYLIEFGLVDQGLAAYEQAVKHQSPETMEADRVRGDYLFDNGRYEEAVEPYSKLIAAGLEDQSAPYSMRLAESYIKLGRFEDAERVLTIAEKGRPKDVVAVMLRADIARGRNDGPTARRLLNEAVELAPADQRPFLKRAQHNFEDPGRFQEVLADLERAVSLQPTSDIARKMRAGVYVRAGQPTQALAELRAGVEAVPASDDLRTMLIAQLVEMRRFDEAHSAVEEAIAARPGNPEWLSLGGDIYINDEGRGREDARARAARYARATELYRRAYQTEPSPRTGFRLAGALLEGNPPAAREALAALEGLGSEVDGRSWLLVMKARATFAAGDAARARELATRALSLVANPPELSEWLKQVKRMNPEWRGQLDYMLTVQPPSPVADMFAVQLLKLQLPLAAEHPRLERELKEITARSTDNAVLSEAYRSLGSLQYAHSRHSEAAETFRAGLRIVPNDLEFNNNLAFTLAKHLNDTAGAVAPAEKAVELAPTNAIALDTLGWVYFELGRTAQAQAMLERANAAAREVHEAAPAKLHLAQVMHKLGRLSDARSYAAEVGRILEAAPGLAVEYQADLDALMEQLKQTE